MQKSESIANLTKALVNVQKDIKPALKSSENPFFHSQYADLNSVWDSCRELLTANGLAVIQTNALGPFENSVIIETVLCHTSGEWVSGELLLPLTKTDPQGVGSAITYGRRYGLASIVGIISDVDDDGNKASGNNQARHETNDHKFIPKAMAATASSVRTPPKAYGQTDKPERGGFTTEDKAATAAQLNALRNIVGRQNIELADVISQEFEDISDESELSKWAASYLISAYQEAK